MERNAQRGEERAVETQMELLEIKSTPTAKHDSWSLMNIYEAPGAGPSVSYAACQLTLTALP